MGMPEVVTAFSEGKYRDDARNEDVAVATGDFFAVVDGATAKQPSSGSASPGRRAAEAVAAAIGRLAPGVPATQAVAALTAAVAGLAPDPSSDELPSASVVLLSVARNEIWAVGDGWASWGEQPVRFSHEVERRAADARAALLRAELQRVGPEQLLASDPGRAMVLPLLAAEHLLANLDRDDPLVFGRLDGRPVPDRLVRVVPLPGDWDRVVLASDGYPELPPTLAAAEEHLARRLREDPLMIADPPATKGVAAGGYSYDDRTWLEIAR